VSDWGLLTNHGRALLCIATNPEGRVRDIADCLGVTERAAQRIVTDLCERGYVSKRREGRRNRYQLMPDGLMTDPLVHDRPIGDLTALVLDRPALSNGRPERRRGQDRRRSGRRAA
jgi:DNA-binding MarR family transcriptional regulator